MFLAVAAVATHADEAAVVVVLAAAASVKARLFGVTAVGAKASWRTGTSGESRVGAEHGDTRAVLGATKGDHVLADVRGDELALVPDDDPLYAVVPELVGVADHVVTAGTFGKWPVLRDLVGDGAHLTLTGVSTDCCVLSTALPAADAGVTVRIAASACAGSSAENHQRALDAMSLYGPQITVTG